MALDRYTAAQLATVARAANPELRRLDPAARRTRLATFVFRDRSGAYWALEPRKGAWHRHADGAWSAASGPPEGWIEGAGGLVRRPSADGLAAEIRARPPAADPVTLLSRLVSDVRTAFERCAMDSTTAETTASQWRLVDDEGRIWTPGLRTGAWYAFDHGAWLRAPAPPDPDQILPGLTPRIFVDLPALGARVVRNFADMMRMGAFLPEPATAPWDPPTTRPEDGPAASGGS